MYTCIVSWNPWNILALVNFCSPHSVNITNNTLASNTSVAKEVQRVLSSNFSFQGVSVGAIDYKINMHVDITYS